MNNKTIILYSMLIALSQQSEANAIGESLVALVSKVNPFKSKNNEQVAGGYFSDAGQNFGVGAIKELAKTESMPGLQKASAEFGSNFGATLVKGSAEIIAAPTTKKLTDDIGKNIGSEASKALAGAAVASTKIAAGTVAGLAGLATTVYVADKAVDRLFPVEQEQANRAEAATRVVDANTKTLVATAHLQAVRDAQEFGPCLVRHRKQVRDTHDCPGNCKDLYARMIIRGQQELAVAKLEKLKTLDEVPVPTVSAEKAEQEVRESFEQNRQGRMRKMQVTKPGWFRNSSTTIELPEEALDLLERRSSLSPKRFSRVLKDQINEKYPNMEASTAEPVLNKNGYPSHITVDLTIDGKKAKMKKNPEVR
ncbi:hypothetical protein JST99_04195 [Candidatus Dependentiae bacterium]|nr:hypothetical protein [Candidatus Dependentiae bacterium]